MIDTATRQTVMHLQELQNTRKFLEVDWSNGTPIYATSRMSVNLGNPPSSPGTPIATATSPGVTATVTATATTIPGTLLGQDTFTRANQRLWGTASNSQKWGGDANVAAVFSISNNKGVVSGGNSAYNAVLGAAGSNVDVVASGALSGYNSANFGTLLRWKDTNNWYKAYISGTTLVIQKKVNGTNTTLSSTNFAASAGTSYTIRFDAVGSQLSAKVWKTGATEPANWTTTTTDATFTSGFCGIRVQLANSITAAFTSFSAKTLP